MQYRLAGASYRAIAEKLTEERAQAYADEHGVSFERAMRKITHVSKRTVWDDVTAELEELRRETEMQRADLMALADMYSGLLVGLFRDLARRRGVLCIIAIRSGKLNNVALPLTQSREISISEFVVPGLTDEDIDGLIEVMDRHHRLGKLKGVSEAVRRRAFSDKAGRQLLVAMIEATLDVRFEEKAVTEADDLTGFEWFLYALMVLATSQRYYLTKQEALMACRGSGRRRGWTGVQP